MPSELAQLLGVVPAAAGSWAASAQGHAPQARLFGGQIAAQAVAAAQHTLATGLVVHSAHCSFLRAGDAGAAVHYEVERVRDSRSFATRLVRARQGEQIICLVTCSAQLPESGPQHQRAAPAAPPPASADLSGDPDGFHAWHHRAWPDWEFARVLAPAAGDAEASQQVWIRHRHHLPDDPQLHLRALLYASDMTLLGCATGRYHDRALQTASLDHTVWFTRPARVDEDWLLYDQRSPAAAGARAVISGALYDHAGRLVALSQQEGLVRPLG